MGYDFDVCVIGSGAGGGPVAYELAKAGRSVLVLEKGPWFRTEDFFKDEIVCCRRSVYTPNLRDERHVIEDTDEEGNWTAESTYDTGRDFWNGNMVGGSSNLMSGFFHRNKPIDFRLLSEFGPIEGANIVDWPISYEDLEPYYAKVEREVGVSGKVVPHPFQEPRSTPDFPYPPLAEHPISSWIDKACHNLGYGVFPVPRAILPQPAMGRNACSYSNYCGSYGCSTGAKGSSRAALLDHAVKTGKCEIRPHSFVYRLESDNSGKVIAAHYYDRQGIARRVDAKIFVVACQPIETARLLLMSPGPRHPDGLANNSGQVGKNLLFSAGGSGTGDILFEDYDEGTVASLKIRGLFVNRAFQDWYVIDDKRFGKKVKGGTVEFLFRHANAISRANAQKWDQNGQLLWGVPLKQKIKSYFTGGRYLRFEIFNDWLPNDNCLVTLDPEVKDKWGNPVARVRVGYHHHDLRIGNFLAEKTEPVLKEMGAKNIRFGISGSPPPNLQAGGCRFGTDPAASVLDPDCRAHGAENLFVSDGSFMPTGGSVTYTWTIYANAFRVADKIKAQL
ncbi:MAG TPA: GMC family oxidoreductase [Caldithrix abyssi]|uniref:GMC family oxidoreductase n=1 Tax=Caldithrix abyssi TaxID=187145 RepID=A0A7V4WU92_CALAY|nr:GMC family oxidoreductase [Caldithrix abyssi]